MGIAEEDILAIPGYNDAVVVYGCLFGGHIQFFRTSLYRRFFEHMEGYNGFAKHGWSNQFFLGTAAAAFLYPSQVLRLYVSAVHQTASITAHINGTVSSHLEGSSGNFLM